MERQPQQPDRWVDGNSIDYHLERSTAAEEHIDAGSARAIAAQIDSPVNRPGLPRCRRWQRRVLLLVSNESEVREMLEWLKDGLSIADSGFAVLGGLVVAAGYSIRPLRRQWKRRPAQIQKQQAEKLDQLGLGRPLETIETVLGKPHLLNRWQTAEGHSEERIYRLPGSWVMLQAREGAVAAYSITITDSDLYYDTGKITRGIVPVRLAHSVFADARTEGAADALEIYPRFSTFHRYYDYGSNAAGGQFIWLAFNAGGAGEFDGASGWDSQQKTARDRAAACDQSRITINTIVICGWDLHSTMLDQGHFGPHPDLIR